MQTSQLSGRHFRYINCCAHDDEFTAELVGGCSPMTSHAKGGGRGGRCFSKSDGRCRLCR